MATINTIYDVDDTVYIIYPDYATEENMHQFTEYLIFECTIDTIEIYSNSTEDIIYYHLDNPETNYRNVRLLESEVFATEVAAKAYLTAKLEALELASQTYIDEL